MVKSSTRSVSVLIILLLTIFPSGIYSQFLFNDYVDATIYYNNGLHTQEKINYNIIENNLYFIDKKDREKKIASQTNNISSVTIRDHQFVYHKAELKEYISGNPEIWIGYKFKGRLKAATIGYGGSATIASVNTYSSYQQGGQSSVLQENEYEISSVFPYYWILREGKTCKIGSFKQLLKLYNKHSDILQHYIDERKVEFENIPKVVALIQYAESLK